MHHDRRFGHAQARAAVLHRHGDPEPAGLGHRPTISGRPVLPCAVVQEAEVDDEPDESRDDLGSIKAFVGTLVAVKLVGLTITIRRSSCSSLAR